MPIKKCRAITRKVKQSFIPRKPNCTMASLTKFSQKIIHKNDQEYVVQFWKVQIYLTLA